jgi:hypothetical protein
MAAAAVHQRALIPNASVQVLVLIRKRARTVTCAAPGTRGRPGRGLLAGVPAVRRGRPRSADQHIARRVAMCVGAATCARPVPGFSKRLQGRKWLVSPPARHRRSSTGMRTSGRCPGAVPRSHRAHGSRAILPPPVSGIRIRSQSIPARQARGRVHVTWYDISSHSCPTSLSRTGHVGGKPRGGAHASPARVRSLPFQVASDSVPSRATFVVRVGGDD